MSEETRHGIGRCPAFMANMQLVRMAAASDVSVLLTGETGTGKEVLAQALHRMSQRNKGPFVPVNCAAIPKDLIESEMFGYCKGAFSGAIADRAGRFELANGGTLFLDEIGDMSMDMQTRLLRVLQECKVDRLGSSREIPINVRIVAATHRDLEAECSAGNFREDLYYRINVLPIASPPLRERKEDILELATHFAQMFALSGDAPVTFDAAFNSLLLNYRWPGNIRELKNFLQRMSVLFRGGRISPGDVLPEFLPSGMRSLVPAGVSAGAAATNGYEFDRLPVAAGGAQAPINDVHEVIMMASGQMDFPEDGYALKDSLADLERKIIERALNWVEGNVTQAADLLKLQRTTLIQKMKKSRVTPRGLPVD